MLVHGHFLFYLRDRRKAYPGILVDDSLNIQIFDRDEKTLLISFHFRKGIMMAGIFRIKLSPCHSSTVFILIKKDFIRRFKYNGSMKKQKKK